MISHNHIEEVLKSSPKASPPPDFTPRVMNKISKSEAKISVAASLNSFNMIGLRDECSLCFLLTGSFYLILGIVLVIGFRTIGDSLAIMEWMSLQPYLTIGLAVCLIVLGMILINGGSTAIRIAKYGAWIFTLFSVVNGTLMWNYISILYNEMLFLGFVVASAFTGILLAIAVKKMELRTV